MAVNQLYKSVSVTERLPKSARYYWTILSQGTESKTFFDGVIFRVVEGTSVSYWIEKVI